VTHPFRAASLAALLLAACGGPTGATCPQGSTLTYANFGSDFMGKYCLKCLSASASDRGGAPKDVNFDTQAEIQAKKADVDSMAASGPKRTNTVMPDGDPKPSNDERAKLGEWLACGAP
jgi:hypothetical protein